METIQSSFPDLRLISFEISAKKSWLRALLMRLSRNISRFSFSMILYTCVRVTHISDASHATDLRCDLSSCKILLPICSIKNTWVTNDCLFLPQRPSHCLSSWNKQCRSPRTYAQWHIFKWKICLNIQGHLLCFILEDEKKVAKFLRFKNTQLNI